ncbi:potassium transporter TrkA [Treponema rectale]|uniref:Trk system potassium uptake protein TrkA n=1 Tax=Treponema rectale TaxID=744512 RepID=A0A840S5N6_9SPIR|nr:NAD-binding protein [Treponema rectale]MBB5217809.1 trk system potassium uptake protein TrkA [Treponema rectale]QOS40464.1 potassium transporter TrkA [Treponema rectale]
MNIMIVGAGFTGIQLARRLINEKNTVTLIDNDADVVSHASNRLDCAVYEADGNNLENLEELGLSKIDALVTVTSSDEINMITCSLVDAVYPDILKIARVRNYAYYVNKTSATEHHAETFSGKHRPLYGIDFMIHPDVEAARAIVSAVEHGAVTDVVSFGKDEEFELSAIQIEKESSLDGMALRNIRNITEKKVIVVYVETEEGASLPAGDTVLHAGDRIGVLSARDDVKSVLEICGTKIETLKKIALVGAGRIGTIVADHIVQHGKNSVLKKLFGGVRNFSQDFVIIDTDKEACKAASERYPKAKVFCGDATDESFIQEEQIGKFNLVISATHNHEMNMVICAYLESLGVEKSIALVSHSGFIPITRKLGVEVAVPLRDTVVDSIMSHLRGKSVTGIHTICNGELEIVECDLNSKSSVNGKTLKDVAMPGEYLMLLVKKNGSEMYELPHGDTVFAAGDHLVLAVKSGNKRVLEKFSGE